MAKSTYLLVGGGLTAAKAAETLRSEGFDGAIHLVGAEPELPYERPPLSKGVLTGSDEEDVIFVHTEQWYVDNEVTLHLSTRATALDRTARSVSLSDGLTLGVRQGAARHRCEPTDHRRPRRRPLGRALPADQGRL